MKQTILPLVILAIGIAGCTLAPQYHRPTARLPETWNAPNTNSLSATNLAAEIGWRSFFPDPRLQQLIELALTNNRDLRSASLRLDLARTEYRIRRSPLLPEVDGNASGIRQRTSGEIYAFDGGTILSTYSVGATASYEVDLFGRIRSLKDAALENFLATEETRQSIQISLVAEVATEYLTQLRLREAKAIAQQTLETVQSSYQLIRKRFELGAASELELRTAEGQVETVRVNAAAFLQQLAESENALAQLIGQPIPTQLPPGIPFGQQQLLGPIPAGIPSETLEKRPDILAAEHTLKSAHANIGAARAAYFPQILLTGSGGLSSTTLDNLFTGPARTWSYGPQLNVPLFNYGATQAKVAASKINAELEVTAYQKAIQTAFREVADALATRGILDQKLKAQERLLAAERRRFELTEARYRQGVDSYVEVLLAQQDLYSAQQNLLQFQAARLFNAITLYRSLGGGWKS